MFEEKIFQLHLKLLVFFFLSKGVFALKSMKIHVPEVVQSGDSVSLSCEYDLEQVALYTIKWYWNEVEFYRYVPKESPPFRSFPMQFIHVDLLRSGPTEVTLMGVRRELTGDYKCEVSADAPLFHTDIKVAHMIVAELPNGNPVMNIEPTKVEIGKKIKAQCYSPGSDPAANITWFINDEEISDDNDTSKIYPTEIKLDQALGLQSSKSVLELFTNKAQFISGVMSIKCQASIYSLWTKSTEGPVRDISPQLAPVLGSTSSQSQVDEETTGQTSNSWSFKPNQNFVKIFVFSFFMLR